MSPPKPPSPVPEGVEEEASPVKSTYKPSGAAVPGNEDIISVTRERNLLRDELLRVCTAGACALDLP